jgi:hypothetical protein
VAEADLDAELARIDREDEAAQRGIAESWWGTVDAGTWSPVPDLSGAALLGFPR